MFEGMWTVNFQGPRGEGAGVVVLVGGRAMGGDSGFTYIGTYQVNGDQLNAEIKVGQYVQGVPNVFGMNNFSLRLVGQANGETVAAEGTVEGAPGKLAVRMTRRVAL